MRFLAAAVGLPLEATGSVPQTPPMISTAARRAGTERAVRGPTLTPGDQIGAEAEDFEQPILGSASQRRASASGAAAAAGWGLT